MFASMLACTIHCRHLMVWKIFAPRFIYEGLQSYVIFGAIFVAYALLVRLHFAFDSLVNSNAEDAEVFGRKTKKVPVVDDTARIDKFQTNLEASCRDIEEKKSAAEASDKTHND